MLTNLLELLAAVKVGDMRKIWAALKPLLDVVFGGATMAPSVGDDAEKAKAACEDIEAECQSKLSVAAADGGPVGKIGDGTILKIVLQILPLILKFL